MRRYRHKSNKITLILKFILILIILLVDYFCIKKIITYNNDKKTSIVVNASQTKNKLPNNSSSISNTSKDKTNNNVLEDVNKDNNEKNSNSNNNSTLNKNKDPKHVVSNNNSTISNKNFFKNSVFLGDSITNAISFYDILNESSVVSKIGLSIPYAKNQIDKVISINPKNVFILLGENDLNSTRNEPSKVINDYKQMVEYLKDSLPKSKIYTLSVLTITKKAEKKHPGLSSDRINKFNSYLKDMSKDLDVSYIDITPVLGDSEKFFEPDGVHPKYSFYNAMLNYIRAYITNIK